MKHILFLVTLNLCIIHFSAGYLTSSTATTLTSSSSSLDNLFKGVDSHDSHRSLEAKEDTISTFTSTSSTRLIPLYRGYGTHFAWMFVGMPAQRQSLIVDTGGHYTAFPCSGCSNCGSHTDEYWNPKNSTTVKISNCAENTSIATDSSKCIITQSFVEGSGWKGYEVTDKVFLGDTQVKLLPDAKDYRVDLKLACIQSSTGLFRTQFADGVLGLSNSYDALPYQLKAKGITTTSTFALCFRVGGGILTLGGMDPRVNGNSVKYAAMRSPLATIAGKNQTDVEGDVAHWYGVTVLKVQLWLKANNSYTSLPDAKIGAFNMGKGTIIDSGTTDTYLPKQLADDFNKAVQDIVGFKIPTGAFSLPSGMTAAKFKASLPTIIFTLKGINNNSVTVMMPYHNYLESVGDKYQLSVFATETDGAVLGASFMIGSNIIFDVEHNRIGFSYSDCNYQSLKPYTTTSVVVNGTTTTITMPLPPNTPALTEHENSDGSITGPSGAECLELIPKTECTATCEKNAKSYVAQGKQDWVSKCDKDLKGAVVSKNCSENCAKTSIVRGNVMCPDEPWSECSKDCMKTRKVVPITESVKVGGKCNYRLQTQTCYSGLCPMEDGDFLIYIDLRVDIDASRWSYVYTESFYDAMAILFKLKQHSVELLSDSVNEYFVGTKLHFKLRLEAKDYADTKALNAAADFIVESARSPLFDGKLIRALNAAANKFDGQRVSRFGWMYDEDVEVLSAVAIPTGKIRDVYGEVEDNHDSKATSGMSVTEKTDLFLLGIAITAVISLAIVLYFYLRLRHEHALYEKDKVQLSAGSKVLHNILNKMVTPTTPSEKDKRHGTISRAEESSLLRSDDAEE